MNKLGLTLTLVVLSADMSMAQAQSLKVRHQLVVAIDDTSGTSFGTDAGTTLFPKAIVNTAPTKDIGTESNAYNPEDPASKPNSSPVFSPAPAWAPAPAFTPPENTNGTLEEFH